MSHYLEMLRRNNRLCWPCLYLAALFLMLGLLGYLVFVGGSPLRVDQAGVVVNATGAPQDNFHPGELAVIRREVCSSKQQALLFYPALRSAQGVLYPLPAGMSYFDTGCRQSGYAFAVPMLPAGQYTFATQIAFQNNLVGRDESMIYPPLSLWISRP